MPFEVRFRPEAEEDLAKLVKEDKAVAQRILSKLKWLAVNCTFVNHEPLSGELAGFFKRRIGDYRVIYMLDTYNQHIEVCVIGHRKDIYKLQ
jgi:mRNA interferase RelE/StbE